MSTTIRLNDQQREAILSLEAGGTLTPDAVLAAAKAKSSPLHDLFTWDTNEAAMKWRLEEARTIIRSVRYIEGPSDIRVLGAPNYVHDPTIPGNQQGYVSVDTLRTDPERARQSLQVELQRVESALTRAQGLAAIIGLDDEVDRFLVRLAKLRRLVEAA